MGGEPRPNHDLSLVDLKRGAVETDDDQPPAVKSTTATPLPQSNATNWPAGYRRLAAADLVIALVLGHGALIILFNRAAGAVPRHVRLLRFPAGSQPRLRFMMGVVSIFWLGESPGKNFSLSFPAQQGNGHSDGSTSPRRHRIALPLRRRRSRQRRMSIGTATLVPGRRAQDNGVRYR
jgi:hypothetical protein